VAENPQTAIPIAQPTGIAFDIPCFFCGYNLRSLAPGAVCTECGRPVQDTFLRGWLVFADKHWLRRLRMAITIILWSLLASFGIGILMVPVVMATVLATDQSDVFWFRAVTIIYGLAYTIVWLWAVWLLTSPEPLSGGISRQKKLASWIRVLCGISIPFSLLYMLLISSRFGSGEPPSDHDRPSWLLMICSGWISWTLFLLLLIHMRRLARRDFKKALGKLMSFLVWGFAATAVGMVAWTALVPMFMSMATLGPGGLGIPGVSGMPSSRMATSTYSPFGFPMRVTNVTAGPGVAATMPVFPTTFPEPTASAPSTATTMPAGRSGMPPFMATMFAFTSLICVGELLLVGWLVSGLVALFWFRSLFTRAIEYKPIPGLSP